MIPYLIAHKVRGEQAYDIAEQMTCPECAGEGCVECDDLGYWWICSTSGHRAYPYWSHPLEELVCNALSDPMEPAAAAGIVPDGWPDHYSVNPSPKAKPSNLLQSLGLLKREPINRRI